MPAQPEPPTLILFGPFEADLQSQELRRQGLRLHLPRQSFQILKVLLERPGVLVTREELRQALWPSDTFVDFEHGLNAAVNRLRECLGDDADQPRYVETLPRRGYRLIAPVDDHRPLVAERSGTIAPQAAPPLQTSGPENIAAARRHKWGVAAVVFGLAILLGLSAWKHTRTLRAPVKQGAKPSAAVLPFKNLSADPENEYFSDGMTEEIITKLSCIHGLAVASHTSVVRFKNTQIDTKEIGRELGVRYLVEGSVRRAGNHVRITAQLIDSETGFHVWAEDFDRDLKDIFAVQDETALKIAGALNLELSPQDKEAVQRKYTQNLQAYEAFLRGRSLVAYYEDSPDKLEEASRHFEEALKLDPNYAPALAGLCGVELYYYRDIDSSPSRLQRGEELAKRAQAIDPEFAEAHVAQAWVLGLKYDYVGAAQEAEKATQLEPGNAYAWDILAWTLAYQQPPDALGAERAAREAIRLQLDSVGVQYHLGRALLLQGRYQEAVAAFNHGAELSPASGLPPLGLTQVYLSQGDYKRAIDTILNTKWMARTAMGKFWLSSAYAAHGDKDKALDVLQQAFTANFRDFAALDASPYFSSLRSDPRFIRLVSRYRNQQT